MSLVSIVIGFELGLVAIPIQFLIVLFFKKSRPSVRKMARIRAKTDWQGAPGIIVNDQDYLYDLQQMQVCKLTIHFYAIIIGAQPLNIPSILENHSFHKIPAVEMHHTTQASAKV